MNILYADTKVLNDKVYGQMIIQLPNYDKDIKTVEGYLATHGVKYEEIAK